MIRALVAVTSLFALTGCALLSSPDPVAMYRFGDLDPPPTSVRADRTVVVLNPISFPEGAGGDRILTATGGRVAYLAGARWVGPSEQLYRSALEAEFLRSGRAVSVSERREAPRNGLGLNLDISSFEARYLDGEDAPPTVVIAGRARIIGPDRAVHAERTFTVRQVASANRVSSVVDAFDAATADFNRELVTWVDASAR